MGGGGGGGGGVNRMIKHLQYIYTCTCIAPVLYQIMSFFA